MTSIGAGLAGLMTLLVLAACGARVEHAAGIAPYESNPRYWQYAGRPVLLLGGTPDDNLFQLDDVEAHLDLLTSAGGNYIRNTMSSRDEGNLWPFAPSADGRRYDLDRWNEEYWQRFDRLLRSTHARGIVVQIELWDPWDLYAVWDTSPWNPANNVNYTTATTRLREQAYPRPRYQDGTTSGDVHDFLASVPAANDDVVLRGYQTRFVDRILEHTLGFDHVLFCATNEIHQPQPLAWSVFWADHVRQRAREAGRRVYATEMFWEFSFAHAQHQPAFDRPETFDYIEASQNSAINDAEANWANLQDAYRRLRAHPRPINHTKLYGADDGPVWAGTTDDVVQLFWRNIVGGAASSRFHRPPAGIGLSEIARRQIRSARALLDRLDVFRCQPDASHALLGDRAANEAYLGYEPGRQYAVYFPAGGSVTLDLSDATGRFSLAWLEIDATRWHDAEPVSGGGLASLTPPADGSWVALLRRS